MKVVWQPAALEDREEAIDFIADDDPGAAFRMDLLFSEAASRLGTFPGLGRPGVIPGTREFIPHPSYRMVYEVGDEEVSILALYHTSRQWPPVSGD